ncbi:MAG: transcriptional repressor [Planctomycetota bacterium]|nr:transcriptional repressor [Planctomycetota bacterium]
MRHPPTPSGVARSAPTAPRGANAARTGLAPGPAIHPGSTPDGDLSIIEPICAVFRRKLKSEGLKYTPERARVLDTIVRREGLFSAEDLLTELKSGGMRVSKATVYRTIKLLIDAGILQRLIIDDEHALYQLLYGSKPGDLIIRLDTKQVIALDAPELIALRDRLAAQYGLIAHGHRLHVFASAQ